MKYFADEGKIVMQAPFAFALALVMLGGFFWVIINWQYTVQIDNLKSRISLRDDQILNYKEKLNGATPEEAKKRLTDLETQLKMLSPRRLTTEQSEKIAEILKGELGTIEIAQDMAVSDAKAYTSDFALAFQKAGWHVSLPMVMGPGVVPPSGTALRVSDPAILNPKELIVRRAFDAAGVVYDILPGRIIAVNQLNNTNFRPTADVEMLLSTRLN